MHTHSFDVRKCDPRSQQSAYLKEGILLVACFKNCQKKLVFSVNTVAGETTQILSVLA